MGRSTIARLQLVGRGKLPLTLANQTQIFALSVNHFFHLLMQPRGIEMWHNLVGSCIDKRYA